MLSNYFDLRTRRLERQENEASSERRHREILEERRDERLREKERRREERAQEEDRRRQEEDRRRRETELAERRHQELMALILASMNSGGNQNDIQNELIRTLQQTVADLQAETASLRQHNGNAETSP